jgi:hypothetical protein
MTLAYPRAASLQMYLEPCCPKPDARVGIFFAAIITITLALACGQEHAEVTFDFNNRTDSTLCVYSSPEGASAAACRGELRPMERVSDKVGCAYGPNADRAPLTVIITAGRQGSEIYNRTAECRVWQKSERTFVIEQRGDEFVVTDPLDDT